MTIQELEKKILNIVNTSDYGEVGIAFIRDYALDGGAQEKAYEMLKKIALKFDEQGDENLQDRIADYMDIVSGFCSPHKFIWPNPLKFPRPPFIDDKL